MDPLSVTASIIAIVQLTSTVVGYLNDVHDAPKDRARCATEASNLYNLLTQLRYHIEDADRSSPWYTAVRALAVEGGPFDQYKSALEQLQPRVGSSSGIARLGERLVWKFSKQEVKDILSRIDRLKTLVEVALTLDHFKLSQEINRTLNAIHIETSAVKDDTLVIRKAIPMLESGANMIERDHDRQRHRTITDWISSTDFSTQQADIISRRQQGTGDWFIESQIFLNWLDGSNKTLFCPGIPGAGKTMISAIAIDHLCRHVQTEIIGVAYIFCNYKTHSDQSINKLAATVLRQLFQQRPLIAGPVADLYERHVGRNTRPSLEELLHAIQTVLVSYTRVFLLARLYVDSLLDKGTKRKVLSTLDGLSKGLQALDEAYNSALDRIQGQLPGDTALAKNVLSWITYARRPLSTLELSHALAVNIGDSELDTDNIPEVEDMISVCAGLVTVDEESNIIRLVHYTTQEYFERTRDTWNPEAQKDIASVCLTYLSFRCFASGLVRDYHDEVVYGKEIELRMTNNPFYMYAVVNWVKHLIPVESECLDLVLDLLQHEGLIASVRQILHHFVIQPWLANDGTVLHLAASFGLSSLSEKLLGDTSKTASNMINSLDGGGQTPLHWAVTNAYEAVVKLFLARDGVEADLKDDDGRTPLWYAAEDGNEVVAKLLLARDDVDVNSNDLHGQTPLSHAAKNGHEAVVKLLLTRSDIEADSKDQHGRTPLSFAAERGREAVVKLLLARHDVEADSKGHDLRTPLSYVAGGQFTTFNTSHDSEAVVKLLLARKDVEVDSKDSDGRTPLSFAAANGKEEVVKLLLARKDVEMNSKDSDGRTPLSFAAKNGREEVVKMLLARDDVEADTKDNRGRTPLSYAAEGRFELHTFDYEAVVKLLLARKDVEVDSNDKSGGTPLSYAAENGNEAVVKLLLARKEVEVDSKDFHGRTPLFYAAANGNEELVKLLLARDDVDINSKVYGSGSTPLSMAARDGDEGVVKLLLARDHIKVTQRDLAVAREKANEGIVKLLLAHPNLEADALYKDATDEDATNEDD
ncbi:MAG: hypothetical protein Q9168_006848 [Polycauliona sp. 1 TL-2023]